MRSITLLVSLAAAALALVLLLVWFARTSAEAVAPMASDSTVESVATELAPASTPGDAVERAADVHVESQRDALAPAAKAAPTCLVRVVEAGSGAPLADAHLWIQNDDLRIDDPHWWAVMRRFNDVEPVLASGFGHEVALDARGEARVPRPARKLSVAAARGALHGEATLEPRAETCVVELKPYHALTVDVVDRGGRPVPGAFVVLFWGEENPLQGSNVLGADEHGRLTIAKLEDQIWAKDYRGPVRVTLAGGAPCEPELVEFTLDRVPREPVTLVAHDFGSLVVQITDPQGRPLALGGGTSVSIDTYALAEAPLTLRAGNELYPPLEAGRAVFSCIGLGLPLSIRCWAKEYEGAGRELAGPQTAGEELLVLIPLAERNATARGRVRGATGTGQLYGQAANVSFSAKVDEEGTFEGFFRPRVALASLAVPWELRFEGEDALLLGGTGVPRVDAELEELDFGEIVVAPPAVLARLHAVDDRGAPVAAWIETTIGAGRWCDEKGRALFQGSTSNLPMRLRATHREWLASDWLEIRAPDSEATLTLRRGAAVTGRVLLPHGANPERCNVALQLSPADATRETDRNWRETTVDGRFGFPACEPGVGRLVVEYDGQQVFERPGIELVAGTTVELPDVDLRTELHPFTLTFALASGAPWLGGHLEVREPDGETSTWITIGPSARAFVLTAHVTLDLWVAGRGARPTLFEGVADGDRLVLPSAPSIVLQLPREVPPPEAPLALVVRVTRTSPEEVAFETDDALDGSDAIVGSDGRAHVSVPWPGEYELAWFVRHTGTAAEFDVAEDEPQTLTIDGASADTLVEAHLSPDGVTRALAEATGR